MPVRLTIIAPFEHPFGTEEHLARDAEAIGCDVTRVPERAFGRWIEKGGDLVWTLDGLVVYMKGIGLPEGATSLWHALEDGDTKTASYHLDLYCGLDRDVEIGADPFWTTGQVFTADGDPSSAVQFAEAGVNHLWLPGACVSDECQRREPTERDGHEQIVFVGKLDGYHRQWPWRHVLIEGLTKRYGSRFGHYGHSSGMRGERLSALYNKPGRIVVGDSLCLPGHSRYWSDRYYETLGRGGFLIAPWVGGIDDHFTDGKHLRYYYHFELRDVFDLVDQYLDEPERAWAIAQQGRAHVAARHTYRHRVAQLLAGCGIPLEGLDIP